MRCRHNVAKGGAPPRTDLSCTPTCDHCGYQTASEKKLRQHKRVKLGPFQLPPSVHSNTLEDHFTKRMGCRHLVARGYGRGVHLPEQTFPAHWRPSNSFALHWRATNSFKRRENTIAFPIQFNPFSWSKSLLDLLTLLQQ